MEFFVWGESLKETFKTAVMVEDAAKTVHLATQVGKPKAIPLEEAEKWYIRYHTQYGTVPGLADQIYNAYIYN